VAWQADGSPAIGEAALVDGSVGAEAMQAHALMPLTTTRTATWSP
jgi:hypothetical protein